MGSLLSAERSAATKTGVSHAEWLARRARGLRWCFRCRTWKQLEAFAVDRSRSQGRASSCKACVTFAGRASRFKLSRAELTALLARARGECELCHEESSDLVIDHNHRTGRVRGVLCNSCNIGLGMFKEDAARLRSAVNYLEVHRG